MSAFIRTAHRVLLAAERGSENFVKFRWWLADRIRPIPVNDVIRDRDDARRFMRFNTDNWDLADEEAQKALDDFSDMQDRAHALDKWRRDEADLVWDSDEQQVTVVPQ